MKLGTNIRRLSGYCWKGFQGQRSKVKVTARLNVLFGGGIHFHGVASRLTRDLMSSYSCLLWRHSTTRTTQLLLDGQDTRRHVRLLLLFSSKDERQMHAKLWNPKETFVMPKIMVMAPAQQKSQSFRGQNIVEPGHPDALFFSKKLTTFLVVAVKTQRPPTPLILFYCLNKTNKTVSGQIW